MTRLLVVGAAGQVGRALLAAAGPPGVEAVGLDRAGLDITRKDALVEQLAAMRADLVVNAAAYTAVDAAESHAGEAFRVNAEAAGELAAACRQFGLPIVHLSTDYVFDGRKDGPYVEEDAVAPLNAYGRSKEAGERAVRAAQPHHLILRTSWVFAATGRNFVRTILRLAAERDEIRVVDDQVGCPTPADDIAAAIRRVAAGFRGDPGLSGTYHLCGSGAVSWHGFASAIVDIAAARTGRRPRVVAIATAEQPTAARRPPRSVLDCGRIAAVFGVEQRPWRPGLDAAVGGILAADDSAR